MVLTAAYILRVDVDSVRIRAPRNGIKNMVEIIILILLVGIFFTFAHGAISGAPWVPTGKRDVERFLEIANIKEGERVYDMGCGDGKVLFACAKKGAKAEGFEIAIFPFILAKIRLFFCKEKKNVKIHYGNIWKWDLRGADVIYIYLMPKAYPRMKRKLEKEARKGTRVVTYCWPIRGWESSLKERNENKLGFFLYEI